LSRATESSDNTERVRSLGTGRVEDPRRGRRRLRRGKTHESHGQGPRGNPESLERSHKGRKASKQVKLAERGDSAELEPGATGKQASACRKGAHSRRGSQATA
jgi:hypothetical protein